VPGRNVVDFELPRGMREKFGAVTRFPVQMGAEVTPLHQHTKRRQKGRVWVAVRRRLPVALKVGGGSGDEGRTVTDCGAAATLTADDAPAPQGPERCGDSGWAHLEPPGEHTYGRERCAVRYASSVNRRFDAGGDLTCVFSLNKILYCIYHIFVL